MVTTKLVPPDGGYAWIIMCAYALHHLIALPVMQGFGLIYKDVFKELEFSATDISLILTTNAAFTMFIGIINGPLIKQLSYRKVSLMGATFLTVGMILTAQSYKFAHYVISYGIIAAAGIGMGLSTYSVALNTFFQKKRSKAAGYALTICGFGPILMPQLISFLLHSYGVKGGVSIIAALAGHTFISTSLLQPVKWHMKREIVEEDDDDKEKKEKEKLLDEEDEDDLFEDNNFNKDANKSSLNRRRQYQSFDEDLHMEAAYGIDTPHGSMLSIYSAFQERSSSVSSKKNPYSRAASRHPDEVTKTVLFEDDETGKEFESNRAGEASRPRLNTKDSEDYSKLESQDDENTKRRYFKEIPSENNEKVYNSEMTVEHDKIKKDSLLKIIGKRLIDIFDLQLLTDTTFLNIMIGMSFAVFAELNFSLLTPFIMQDRGLDTQEIATFMSTLAIVDICFRFIAPSVGDFFKQPIRVMYLWALTILMLSRFSLLLAGSNYTALLACAAFLGLSKGFRTVYWSLVIPSCVPLERLPSALGLQSAFNSIFVVIGGSFIGVVRDVTGSYSACIVIINCVTFTTILMWTTELIYKRYKAKQTSAAVDIEIKS